MTSTATPSWRLPVVVGILVLLQSACGGHTSSRSGAAAEPGPGGSRPPQTAPPPMRGDATGSALLTWQPPTRHEDGSPLTDLSGYRIEYGMVPESLDSTVTLTNPGLTSYLVENLTTGQWFFTIRAFDTEGRTSARSGMASKTIG